MPIVAPAAEWGGLFARIKSEAPEVFDAEGRVLNLMEGEWKDPGFGRHYESPIDGRSLGRIPMIHLETARTAVKFAKAEAAGERLPGRVDEAEGVDCAAADVGDREAVRAGVDGY